ncbi:DNA-directed RNA polymerase subunit L [Candidatus Woesearchaeota archaeon]|nr:DNA-directed RNA polymerase subunit L [Candidatus Woesearchaeota archaeon]
MELNVVEETPKRLVAEVKGASHTLCNALKSELWKNSHVKVATYAIKHPLVGSPTITVETDGTAKPRKVVADAVSKLSAKTDKLKKEIKKLRV